jgi:hypothetical protein
MRFAAVVLVAACGTDDPSLPPPVFPEDYATSYVEVRDCRSSADHDLRKIRVLADPAALDPYTTRTGAFPLASIVLKEEYDFADIDCTGPLLQWTVMERTDEAATGGWLWQRIDADRSLVTQNEDRCINCHDFCGKPPDGFEGTCALP